MADVIHEAAAIVPDPTQIDVKLFNRWSFDDVQVLRHSILTILIFFYFPFLIYSKMKVCYSMSQRI